MEKRDEDWLRGGRLEERPDAGFWRGLLIRAGLARTIHVWGLRVRAPRRVVPRATRWFLRTGHHEYAEAYAALRTIDARLPVIEVGAGLGTISCVVNGLLVSPERHVAVEMNAAVLPHLERNRDLNGARFEVVHGAVHYGASRQGVAPDGRWRLGGQAGSAGDVPRVRLSELAAARGWDQLNLVMDIEGAEFDALREERAFFADQVRTLVVELHPWGGPAEDSGRFIDELLGLGFRPRIAFGAVMSFTKDASPPKARRGSGTGPSVARTARRPR